MNADFRGASLTGANIAGVDFSRAKGLEQDQLDNACADGATRTPPGLVAKACHRGARVRVVSRNPAPPAPPAAPAPPAPPRYFASVD